MLFNSYGFILLFLPLTLFIFFRLGTSGHHRIAISWLVGASLFFYGWWNPAYLLLIIISIIFNYAVGLSLAGSGSKAARKITLAFGITANLLLLGYFKYANFFVDNVNSLVGSDFHLNHIILPLAISFFTFQQIAYLVDAYNGETREYSFLHYCLFVTFFPQLIAGPIVHHKEILPQFAKDMIYRFNNRNFIIGATIFALGLFKKVVLADGIAVWATPVFNAAEAGEVLTFLDAWVGALAYTFQLYFDFSGYSDMAIGIARLFGILLPLNFNSPYKAVNIIDFWRRWHITLSRFLRDYLYIPLGGSRKGKTRRYINLMITMLLGGMWHGAGWTFIMWGALHGIYLIINHAWHVIRKALGHDISKSTPWGRGLARLLTFLVVVIAWVFFRAESFTGAMNILEAMAGLNGYVLPDTLLAPLNHIFGFGSLLSDMGWEFAHLEFADRTAVFKIFILFMIVWYAPNTQQFMLNYNPCLDAAHPATRVALGRLRFSISTSWAFIFSLIFLYALIKVSRTGEFLYFNF